MSATYASAALDDIEIQARRAYRRRMSIMYQVHVFPSGREDYHQGNPLESLDDAKGLAAFIVSIDQFSGYAEVWELDISAPSGFGSTQPTIVHTAHG